jgi:hypothetical protein
MRLHAALVVLGFLAVSALVTDTERGRGFAVIDGEPCAKPVLRPDPHGEAPLGGWATGLLRVTCNLDGALLGMENYYRADLGYTLAGGLPARRHKPGK